MLTDADADCAGEGAISLLSLVALSMESSADFFLEICNISFMTRFISSSKLSSFFKSSGSESALVVMDATDPGLGIAKTSSFILESFTAFTTETDLPPESDDALFNKVFSSSLERSIMLTPDEAAAAAAVAAFLSDCGLSLPELSSLPSLSCFSTWSPSSPFLGAPSLIFSTDLMLRTPLEADNRSSDCCFPGVAAASL